jgi:dinuclear metal center YbgI/SA1388 family protein
MALYMMARIRTAVEKGENDMSTSLTALSDFFDTCMQPQRFQDYCPNGLQVEGRDEVYKLASGVTASQALLDAALQWGADAILVHHGYFWRGEAAPVVGMKKRRLATLLGADVSLFAYHLPLDAHPELGNNACFGKLLDLTSGELRPLQPDMPDQVGNICELPEDLPLQQLLDRIRSVTGREPLHIGRDDDSVRTVAWCTGAAQDYIEAAVAAGADIFITGEVSEQTVHIAREEGIHFVAAGHHATERYGVQALASHAASELALEHQFIDIDNPV